MIVGVAQITHRGGDAPDPIDLAAAAARAAAADAGAGERLLRSLDVVAVPAIASRQDAPDPAALVAAAVGASSAATVGTPNGGDAPQALVADLAAVIARGEAHAALVAGAEAMNTLARAMKAGTSPGWPAQDPGARPARTVGSDRPGTSAAEAAAGLIAPITVYPLFENALWAASGRSLAEHRAWLGRLWARFSDVAAGNPHAWTPGPLSAQAIATPTPANRQVTLPYTKLMNANIQTDQAAAVLLCAAETATGLGVPRDRWVFPLGAAGGHDHWHVTERWDLRSSPAIRAAGRSALAAAAVGLDDVAHLDLYSCFPSAVQIAAAELGLDLEADPRPPTVTGGLTFAGGPGNAYALHAIAAIAERLRGDAGATGLVTAVGWYLTKHAAGVYGSAPPARPFRAVPVQAEAGAAPRRAFASDRSGAAVGESVSVIYERDGAPSFGILAALCDDGARTLAQTVDPDTLAEMTAAPLTGRAVALDGRGGFEVTG